ncbi:hypothetical protein CMV_013038 [Castanea mollissima]|uniref:Uncharacterized protein n=1 Tax=Castanea mollissima TaxID=60419 RepID=A0A8J4RFN9_9ROSI|nr:hypothetical protein CMV_013038 [Castanea mollissima]
MLWHECAAVIKGHQEVLSIAKKIIYCEVLEKLEQVQLPRNNDSFAMDVQISPKINKARRRWSKFPVQGRRLLHGID